MNFLVSNMTKAVANYCKSFCVERLSMYIIELRISTKLYMCIRVTWRRYCYIFDVLIATPNRGMM